MNAMKKIVCSKYTQNTVLCTLLDILNMAQRSLRKQTESQKSKSQNNKTREFYLLEKLYDAMRSDKKRGKRSSSARELYLLEKLYDAMRKDKVHNKKLSAN
jgi:hypothetical protein